MVRSSATPVVFDQDGSSPLLPADSAGFDLCEVFFSKDHLEKYFGLIDFFLFRVIIDFVLFFSESMPAEVHESQTTIGAHVFPNRKNCKKLIFLRSNDHDREGKNQPLLPRSLVKERVYGH